MGVVIARRTSMVGSVFESMGGDIERGRDVFVESGGYRGVTWLYNLFIGTVAGEETGFIKCDVMP